MTTTRRPRYPLQTGTRMLPTDAFFWYAESAAPQVRPLVAGLFMLDRAPDRQRFHASIERLVACVPRLQQRVVDSPFRFGLPEWDDDPNFDLDYHLRSVVLPEPANERQLFDFAAAVFATPLDHLRPLWEGYLIEGLAGGRAAYFLKMHHSVMDGAGSVALFDAMTQARRTDPVRPLRRSRPQRGAASLPRGFAAQARERVEGALAGVAGAAEAVVQALREPAATLEALARAAASLGPMLRDMVAPSISDPLAARCTGIGRRVDGVTFSLDRLRHIKMALGISLNDLVLTSVAGAVARYHEHHGLFLEEVNCIVPMSLRQEHERHALGNRIGAFSVRLPISEPDPLTRVERIHQQTDHAKSNRHGVAYQALLQAVALVPNVGFRALAQQAAGRVHLICSNVPGPPTQRYIGGAKIEAVYPFAPVMLGTPLSIAFLSYGDSYAVGIDTDPAAIPDPERVRRYLEQEIDEIECLVAPRSRPSKREATPSDPPCVPAGPRAARANGSGPV